MDLQNNKNKDNVVAELQSLSRKNENVQVKEETKKAIRSDDSLFLYFAVFAGQMLIMVSGSTIVWTSPALIKFQSNDTEINPLGRPITTEEISMVAGIPILAGFIGALLLPKLSDIFGRKRYLQILGLSILLAGTALAFSTKMIFIIIARGLLTIVLHGACAVVPIYVTEISESHNRGKFGCYFGLFQQIGHFFCYLLGPIFSIRNLTLITTAPAFIFFLCSLLVPESPYYLLSKGKEEESIKALQNLRTNKTNKEIEQEFELIRETLKTKTNPKSCNILPMFKKRENRIAVMLALLPLLVQHLSGVGVIMSFLAPFFNTAGTRLSGSYVAILVSSVKISCITFTSFVVEKFGRKRMLVISSFGTSVPLFALGVFFYLKHVKSTYIIYLEWLPLTGILCNVILYCVGLSPIPVIVMNELFSTELRAAGSSFINTVINIAVFGLTFAFPLITENFGTHWCIWMFGSFCFIGGVFIYKFLPETKGKSFNEIQEILKQY